MAGTVVVTPVSIGASLTRYDLVWTSDASGDVSANLFDVWRGRLIQIKFVPDGGATAPTDLYDVTLVDEDSVDLLDGRAANLSATAGSYLQWDPPIFMDGTQQLDLVIANAGNAKGGTVSLWVMH